MNPDHDLQALVSALKLILKQKHVRYADVAKGLGLSLPTVKRMFATGDMSLRRLAELSNWLGLSLHELVALAPATATKSIRFTEEQELFFAENPMYLVYFMALKGGRNTPEQIAARHGLKPLSTRRYLKKLEELKIIEVYTDSRVRVLVDGTFIWDEHGPLGKVLSRRMAENFLQHALKNIGQSTTLQMNTTGRRLTKREFEELKSDMEALEERTRRLSQFNSLGEGKNETVYVSTMWIADVWDDPIYQHITNL